MPPRFCAVCTSERGPFVVAPMGRGDAPVLVCRECNEEHPRTGRYAFDDSAASARRDQTQIRPARTGTKGST